MNRNSNSLAHVSTTEISPNDIDRSIAGSHFERRRRRLPLLCLGRGWRDTSETARPRNVTRSKLVDRMSEDKRWADGIRHYRSRRSRDTEETKFELETQSRNCYSPIEFI